MSYWSLLASLAYALMIFLLGLQSLTLNQGHANIAVMSSFAIGLLNYFVIRQIVIASVPEGVLVAGGGAVGLWIASKVFWKYKGRK